MTEKTLTALGPLNEISFCHTELKGFVARRESINLPLNVIAFGNVMIIMHYFNDLVEEEIDSGKYFGERLKTVRRSD